MSEIKLISPLLDGFSVGNPMSEHHGIRCCPAIKENTDKKYILKIISVPASQVQMDALLLAGAYKDPADAMEYFRQTGEDILKEAQLLKKLSRLDGFLPYEDWQMEPITRRRLGYEIYLVGSYKRSLERFLKKHAVTHLEAVNLGLDLCAALSVCRSAGALYVALKPTNIFVSEKKDYRIGDLGFVDLDALRYTSLPEKYQSRYTPPELFDPMESVNLTADTYAVGMILYQLYNDGQLPFKGKKAPEEILPSPINADYEMAEIIMKAIHPDPTQRWTDPKDMGKALAAYMQRNAVNDVPITPHTPLDVRPEDIVPITKAKPASSVSEVPIEPVPVEESPIFQEESPADMEPIIEPERDTEVAVAEPEPVAEVLPVSEPEPVTEVESSTELQSIVEEIPIDEPEPAFEDASAAEALIYEEIPADEDNAALEEEPAAEPEPILPEKLVAEPEPILESEAITEQEPIPAEEPAMSPDSVSAETTSDAKSTSEEKPLHELESDPFNAELSKMLARADTLIAHQPSAPVVLNHIPEISDPFAFVRDDSDDIDRFDLPEDPLMDSPEDVPASPVKKERKKKEKKFVDPKIKRRRKHFALILLALLMLAAAGSGAFWYYQNLYLQTVDALILSADSNTISVSVDAEIDPSLLIVRCIDESGKADSKGMSSSSTVFTGLEPNSEYTIQLKINGFHKLLGETSGVCTTEATTRVRTFTSAVGSEDGSVLLSFTVDGEEPKSWTVYYGTEGEPEQRKTFTGHSVPINGLTVGKSYTFRLDPGENMALGGQTTLVLTASRMVQAENVSITSENGTDISVSWKAPGDLVVDSWDVRCYSSAGYDQQLTTTQTSADFAGLDPSLPYTIEITAAGMTQSARTNITANPLNVTALTVDESSTGKLKVSWEYTGEEPKDGWLMIYSLVGGEKRIVKCAKPNGEIPSKVPGGTYQISFHIADGTTVFNSSHTHTVAADTPFEKFNVTADKLAVNLLKTPEQQNWRVENIDDSAFTNSFQSGDTISIGMRYPGTVYLLGSKVEVIYVIQDAYGNIIPELVASEQMYWNNIWNGGNAKNGELNVPKTPTTPGEYVLKLYIDGMTVAQLDFSIN